MCFSFRIRLYNRRVLFPISQAMWYSLAPLEWYFTRELQKNYVVLYSIQLILLSIYIISVSCVEISCLLLYSLNYYWFYILIRQTRMGLYFPTSLDLLYDYYVRIYTQNVFRNKLLYHA